jgi:hypothetical protein
MSKITNVEYHETVSFYYTFKLHSILTLNLEIFLIDAAAIRRLFYFFQFLLPHMSQMKIIFLASSTLNDMFTHFEQVGYLDFYTLIKLHICHFTARSV